ncbi:Cystatin domain [Dillenia turbinata]|uniref:Cystatin domain n=1 Tax=Dillenia turbinata TaxID=194707 RepID=A0AAN8ZCJ6_9MAGN
MEKIQVFSLLLLYVLLWHVASGAVAAANPIDPTDTYVIDIAEFAIKEYNKKSVTNLDFEYVIHGSKELGVKTVDYRLVIAAKEWDTRKYCDVHVVEKLPNYSPRDLLTFKFIEEVPQPPVPTPVTGQRINSMEHLEVSCSKLSQKRS